MQETSRSGQVQLAAVRPRHGSLVAMETGVAGSYTTTTQVEVKPAQYSPRDKENSGPKKVKQDPGVRLAPRAPPNLTARIGANSGSRIVSNSGSGAKVAADRSPRVATGGRLGTGSVVAESSISSIPQTYLDKTDFQGVNQISKNGSGGGSVGFGSLKSTHRAPPRPRTGPPTPSTRRPKSAPPMPPGIPHDSASITRTKDSIIVSRDAESIPSGSRVSGKLTTQRTQSHPLPGLLGIATRSQDSREFPRVQTNKPTQPLDFQNQPSNVPSQSLPYDAEKRRILPQIPPQSARSYPEMEYTTERAAALREYLRVHSLDSGTSTTSADENLWLPSSSDYIPGDSQTWDPSLKPHHYIHGDSQMLESSLDIHDCHRGDSQFWDPESEEYLPGSGQREDFGMTSQEYVSKDLASRRLDQYSDMSVNSSQDSDRCMNRANTVHSYHHYSGMQHLPGVDQDICLANGNHQQRLSNDNMRVHHPHGHKADNVRMDEFSDDIHDHRSATLPATIRDTHSRNLPVTAANQQPVSQANRHPISPSNHPIKTQPKSSLAKASPRSMKSPAPKPPDVKRPLSVVATSPDPTPPHHRLVATVSAPPSVKKPAPRRPPPKTPRTTPTTNTATETKTTKPQAPQRPSYTPQAQKMVPPRPPQPAAPPRKKRVSSETSTLNGEKIMRGTANHGKVDIDQDLFEFPIIYNLHSFI